MTQVCPLLLALDVAQAFHDQAVSNPHPVDAAHGIVVSLALRSRQRMIARSSPTITSPRSKVHPRQGCSCAARARCRSSPARKPAIRLIRDGRLGEVIEASNTFGHSSDLDRNKPINWKRQRRCCGEAG
jgi:hypothetical protein